MILVGLTGGIGAGKSTVSAMLAERGAAIVDADQIARDLQAPGSQVLAAMAERFGDHILAADGADRLERVSGMAHLTGLPVEVRRASGPPDPGSWSGLPQGATSAGTAEDGRAGG